MEPAARPETVEEGRYKVPALLVLSEIASSLSTDSTVDDLVTRYLSTMVRIAGARAGAVRVLTADGAGLRLVNAIGMPAEAVERERLMPVDCGVCGEAIAGRTPVSACGPESCVKTLPEAFLRECGEIVAVPLRHREAVLGVYDLFMPQGAGLAEEVRILFGAIGEHLGMALENARLARENARVTLVSERQLLANQVHDSLAQTLAYARMRIVALRDAQRAGDDQRADRYVSELESAVESAYAELRALLGQFRQPMDPRGLPAALEALLETFATRSGATVELVNRAPDVSLSPEEEMHVFHIVQEALANIYKHAGACNVKLSIGLIDDWCQVCIEDDGIGFSHADPESDDHFGISIMRERARRLGGEILINTGPHSGVRVCLSFPAQIRVRRPHGSPARDPD